jgi:hypothetical protein
VDDLVGEQDLLAPQAAEAVEVDRLGGARLDRDVLPGERPELDPKIISEPTVDSTRRKREPRGYGRESSAGSGCVRGSRSR